MQRVLIRYGELIVTLTIFLTSLYLLIFINNFIKISSTRGAAQQLGPKFWPFVILIGIVFLTGIIIFNVLREIKKGKWDTEEEDAKLEQFNDKRLLTLIGLTVFYVFILTYVGFLSVTPIFIILISWLIGIRVIWKNLVFSILLTAIFIYVFGNFLDVPLPRGLGFFREISFFFY